MNFRKRYFLVDYIMSTLEEWRTGRNNSVITRWPDNVPKPNPSKKPKR